MKNRYQSEPSSASLLATVACAVLLAISSFAHAQEDRPRKDRQPPSMEERVERMTEGLDLTEEQSEQLLVVLEASAIERKAILDKYEAQMKPELCAVHLDTVEQVRDILSSEQAAVLEDRLERWAAHQGGDDRKKDKRRQAMQDCTAAE